MLFVCDILLRLRLSLYQCDDACRKWIGFSFFKIFIEGGNSCTNSFVVGALIGAKQGVNKVVLSAPVCGVIDELTCSCLLRTSFIRIISFNLSTDYSTL